MDKPSTFTLPAGTICMRNGLPFVLQHATQIECAPGLRSSIEAMPLKPEVGTPRDVFALSVYEVLDLCERSFVLFGGCTMTDMPHVPLSSETSWTMDIGYEMAAIASAKEKLCGARAENDLDVGAGDADEQLTISQLHWSQSTLSARSSPSVPREHEAPQAFPGLRLPALPSPLIRWLLGSVVAVLLVAVIGRLALQGGCV